MLRQIVLLSGEGRVIESLNTLQPALDSIFEPIPVDSAFVREAIHDEDHQAFHEAIGLARASSPTEVKLRNKSGQPINFDIRWSAQLTAFVVLASSSGTARNLTDRQTRVLRLLCSDKTLGKIAEALGIKVTTVQTYASRLRERANVATNHGLAIWALKNGKV